MKSNLMFLMAILAMVVVACQPKPVETPAENKESVELTASEDGYFIHISSGYDKPQRAMMALSFATKVMDKHNVALFFDLEGVKLLKKNAEDITLEHYTPMKEALTLLTDKGVLVMACPMCLKVAGIAEEDLIQGVIPADKEKFFGFTKGRIISLDY